MRKILFILLMLFAAKAFPGTAGQDSIVGVASYYANSMHGRKTASGEVYDKNKFTCAHRTFKFGTKLRVRHLVTGKEVIVRVTDRGPFSKRYTIDLSYAAAKELGIIRAGHAKVAIFSYDELQGPPKREDAFPRFWEFPPTTNSLPSVTPNIYTAPPSLLPLLPIPPTKKK